MARFSPKKANQKKNRAERVVKDARKAAQYEVDMKVNQIYDEVTLDVTTKYTMLFLYCLHNQCEWGNKRLTRLLEYVEETADSIEKGYLDFHDINRTMSEEVKMFVDAELLEEKAKVQCAQGHC